MAGFSRPSDAAVDNAGDLYAMDCGNNRITKGTRAIILPRFVNGWVSDAEIIGTLSVLSAVATVIHQSGPSARNSCAGD